MLRCLTCTRNTEVDCFRAEESVRYMIYILEKTNGAATKFSQNLNDRV